MMCVCVCVCLCLCKREGERDTSSNKTTPQFIAKIKFPTFVLSLREREREEGKNQLDGHIINMASPTRMSGNEREQGREGEERLYFNGREHVCVCVCEREREKHGHKS